MLILTDILNISVCIYFLSFFISQSEVFYLLTAGVGGYCYTRSHSMTHTHTLSKNALNERLFMSVPQN